MAGKAGVLGALAIIVAVVVGGIELPANAGSETGDTFSLTGRVVQVSDGDTFNLLVNGRTQRVRMASIDAPETGKGNEQPGQPFGQASRQALAQLVSGKTLTLSCHERDRYERAICDVPLPEGGTANQQMVAQGMAWANMEKRGRFLRDTSLPALQETAQRNRLGLWQGPNPVEPWVWRYQCWRQRQC